MQPLRGDRYLILMKLGGLRLREPCNDLINDVRRRGCPGNRASHDPTFRVQFVSQDKVFEVFAKQIYSSDLYGFIEVEEFVFGERSGLLVDPSEEKLKAEFQGVKRSYIPMHAVIRIDEVEDTGPARIRDSKTGTVTPLSMVPPPRAPRDAD